MIKEYDMEKAASAASLGAKIVVLLAPRQHRYNLINDLRKSQFGKYLELRGDGDVRQISFGVGSIDFVTSERGLRGREWNGGYYAMGDPTKVGDEFEKAMRILPTRIRSRATK